MSTTTIPEINIDLTAETAQAITAPAFPEINTREMATEARKFFDTLEMEDDYTENGIRANLGDWAINKLTLINLLRQHPDWNEEAKAVILHSDISRTTNISEAVQTVYDIYNAANLNLLDENTHFKFSCTKKRIVYLIEQGNIIGEESNCCISILNNDFPDLHARVGQKTSRLINKLFELMGFNTVPEYNRLYAKLSDAINPLTVKTTIVLSVHWMDFLTMSRGNSWSSCHGIESNASYSGCYKAGCLSYANDDVSLIFYTIDNGYEGNTPWKEKKITRQVFFYKDGVLVQERLYPQCNDNDNGTSSNSQVRQYRTIVESIFAACENRPNLWKKYENIIIDKNSDCFMYDDWDNFKNWKVCFNDIDTEQRFYLNVGSDSYCLKCGSQKDGNSCDEERTLMCTNCDNNEIQCESCGDWCDEDDMYLIDGEYYCCNCCFYCDYHEQQEVCDDEVHVRNYGYVCDEALHSGSFAYCEHCGAWVYNDDSTTVNTMNTVETWCEWCADRDAVRCDNCGMLFDESIKYNIPDGDCYCPDCYDEYAAETEDETENVMAQTV